MVDQVATMAAELRSTADRVLYLVTFFGTIVVGFTWAIIRNQRRRTDLPDPNSNDAKAAQSAHAWKNVRPLFITSYSIGAVGIVLALVGLIGSNPALLYIGVSLAITGWLIRMLAEFKYLRCRRHGEPGVEHAE